MGHHFRNIQPRKTIMQTVSRMVALISLLVMGAIALPAAASQNAPIAPGLQSAVMMSEMEGGYTTPVAFKSGLRHMSLEEMGAVIVGAAVVGTAADLVFDGGLFGIVGVVVGAALGSEWYEKDLWPFNKL
jgi:hypothetical protein